MRNRRHVSTDPLNIKRWSNIGTFTAEMYLDADADDLDYYVHYACTHEQQRHNYGIVNPAGVFLPLALNCAD